MAHYLPQLIGAIAAGVIKAQVDLGDSAPGGRFLGVDQIHRAQAWLHSGKSMGKVVVQLQNPWMDTEIKKRFIDQKFYLIFWNIENAVTIILDYFL